MNEIKYIHTADVHNTAAAEAFIPFLLKVIQPLSVIDVGCGLGTWLKVFSELGIKDIIGIDGFNVDVNLLAIPLAVFIEHDLREPINLKRKFDLSLCLEVGEHLPDNCADNLINLLTSHSDNILFSAALPLQGGQNHINEQPFGYWVKKFNDRGFVVRDVFRELIWDNKDIDWWYRQNMLMVTKGDTSTQRKIHDYYHPQQISDTHYEKKYLIEELIALKNYQLEMFAGNIQPYKAFKLYIKSCLKFFRNKFSAI